MKLLVMSLTSTPHVQIEKLPIQGLTRTRWAYKEGQPSHKHVRRVPTRSRDSQQANIEVHAIHCKNHCSQQTCLLNQPRLKRAVKRPAKSSISFTKSQHCWYVNIYYRLNMLAIHSYTSSEHSFGPATTLILRLTYRKRCKSRSISRTSHKFHFMLA